MKKVKVFVGLLLSLTIIFGASIQSFAGQGEQIAILKNSEGNSLGYYEYLPRGYDDNPIEKFPIVIFWHGLGETGDGTTQIAEVLKNGPPKNINNGTHYPAIVISPQTGNWPTYSSLDTFVEYIFAKYGNRIDLDRFYMTGLSMGGRNTWGYAQAYPEKLAAIVPVCGASNPGSSDVSGMIEMGIWAFHNLGDGTVNVSCTYNWINALTAVGGSPLMTIYDTGNASHDSWTAAYNDQNMWNWLFEQTRSFSGISINAFSAAPESFPNHIANDISFTANVTDDVNITEVRINLSEIGGSANALMSKNGNNFSLDFTVAAGLIIGNKTIELTATDSDGNSKKVDIAITVTPEPGIEMDLTQNGDIIATVTAPSGGGNHDIKIIRDGVKPAIGSADSKTQYDTYDGNAEPFEEYIGYTYGTTYELKRIVFQEGQHFGDGGFFANGSLRVQVLQNGQWNDVNTVVDTPYPVGTVNGDFGSSFETYSFTLDNVLGEGIRIIGDAGGTKHFISVGELEVFGAIPDTDPVNQAPLVNGGSDQTITLPTNSVSLNGIVSDDGLPEGSVISNQWSVVSGPGSVTFSDAAALDTSAGFSTEGTYVLRLTADDSELSASDEITITVNPEPIVDPPPAGDIPSEGLVLYLPFDEGEGDIAADSSESQLDGLLINSPTWVEGQVNNALQFDGIDDIVAVPYDPALALTDSISIGFWFKPDSYDGTFQCLISRTNWNIQINPYGQTINFSLDWGGLIISCPLPTVGEWHHFAGTYDGSSMKIYIDGELASEVIASGSFGNYGTDFYIGSNLDNYFFTGSMDDIYIYNRGLNTEEVQQVMMAE